MSVSGAGRDRVELGPLEMEAEPDGASLQLVQVGLSFPGQLVVDAVGGQRHRGFDPEVLDRFPLGIECLDGQRTALGLGVDRQRVTQEQDRPGGHRTPLGSGFDRDESVDSQSGQADALLGWLGVGVQLGGIAGPGPPVLGVGAGVVEVNAVADDDRVGSEVRDHIAPVPVLLLHVAVGQEHRCAGPGTPVPLRHQLGVGDRATATDPRPDHPVAAVGQLQVLPVRPRLVGSDRFQ